HHPAGLSLEQPHPCGPLERRDLPAHRRLGVPQLGRRGRERAEPADLQVGAPGSEGHDSSMRLPHGWHARLSLVAECRTTEARRMTTSNPTVAVLGLGRMGTAITQRLTDRGWTVTGWTRSGGSDPGPVVRDADVVLLALFDG